MIEKVQLAPADKVPPDKFRTFDTLLKVEPVPHTLFAGSAVVTVRPLNPVAKLSENDRFSSVSLVLLLVIVKLKEVLPPG